MTRSRRHGQELEDALLKAAWDQVVEHGYASLTIDAVAARANTSRAVIYRRWDDKHELLRAAARAAVERTDSDMPDTGSLRSDTIALMSAANNTLLHTISIITVHLDGYYTETRTNPADLRDVLVAGRPRPQWIVLQRAVERGEVSQKHLTERIASVPHQLQLQEFLLTLKPVPLPVIHEIVDTIFLPIVMPRQVHQV
jgi:AcrR family transcriptional regulator